MLNEKHISGNCSYTERRQRTDELANTEMLYSVAGACYSVLLLLNKELFFTLAKISNNNASHKLF